LRFVFIPAIYNKNESREFQTYGFFVCPALNGFLRIRLTKYKQTFLIIGGIDLIVLASILGRSNLKMVMRYAHRFHISFNIKLNAAE